MVLKRAVAVVLAMGLLAGAAGAATEAQKDAAIDAGLAWLASTQLADGRWNYGDDNYDTAATGAAVLSFLEEGYSAGSDVIIGATNYGDVVGDGLNYIFSRATAYGIANEPAGNPDLNGNQIGIKFVPGGNNTRDTYVTGLVVPAIAATGTPGALVTVGSEAGRTYQAVLQDTIEYFAYGQADPGTWGRGGWRYYADYGEADNSTAQWPIIGSLYAGSMGVTTPAFVKTELKNWINFIQNPADGGSYYDSNFAAWNSNVTRTGALLVEMAYAGYPGGTPAEQAAYAAALNYLNNQWNTGANATWNGNFGHPYAMWAVYKGLEINIGLGDTTTITPRPQGAAVIDPGDVWNWWEDYCEYLVTTQAAGGNWGGYSNWTGPLATAWYINILNATEVPPPPVIPEPMTMAGLVLGIGGLATYLRKRRQ